MPEGKSFHINAPVTGRCDVQQYKIWRWKLHDVSVFSITTKQFTEE